MNLGDGVVGPKSGPRGRSWWSKKVDLGDGDVGPKIKEFLE